MVEKAQSFDKDFVGREVQFTTLASYLEGALGNHGRLIFISGEAGIGKTKLIEVLGKYAETLGFRFLKGRCLYREKRGPLSPVHRGVQAVLPRKGR